MKCPRCGYLSFDSLESCKRCGAPMLAEATAARPSFLVDDDLAGVDFPGLGDHPTPASPASSRGSSQPRRSPAPASAPEDGGAEFDLDGWGVGAGVGVSPIIEREDDVPERFWAPEIVGLGPRAIALLIDQVLLAGLIGVFALGAVAALWLSGFNPAHLFAPAGLQAAFLPFALLAALLSLVYHVAFHGWGGQTPGKAVAGVEVRTDGGTPPSFGRAALRWCAGVLGLACAGAGAVWALFEPRRRSWADLLSKTTLAACRGDEPDVPDER